jgi:tetratricopeptide (TPR) repeat protein
MSGNMSVFEEAMSKGHAAAWDQQWARAIACYRTALQEMPADATALTSLGFALLRSGKPAEALLVYQRAAALTPGDPVAPEKCGEILEQLGRLQPAVQTYLAVAEIHIRRRDIDKAITNWNRAVTLAPDHLVAHSRLALALERTGKNHQASLEYLEVGRLFQRANDAEKAAQAVAHALQLEPQSQPAREAVEKLRRGMPLASPTRGTGVVAPRDTSMLSPDEAQALAASLVSAAVAEGQPLPAGEGAPASPELASNTTSPVAAAQELALAQLAEMLFEQDMDTSKTAATLGGISRGNGVLSRDAETRRAQALMALGQAIAQTNSNPKAALGYYASALNAGMENPLVQFMLGALNLEIDQPDGAIKYFPAAAKRVDVGLGALVGLGVAYSKKGQPAEAFKHLMEAIKQFDLQLVKDSPNHQDRLAEAYESLEEALGRTPEDQLAQLVPALTNFLWGEGWEERIRQARQNLDASAEEGQVTTLGEMLASPGSDRLLETLQNITRHINKHRFSSAMEEAYYALHLSPVYLPAHVRIAEILVAEDRRTAAIAKYTVTADAYQMRGDTRRAARLMQEVLKLNPMDVNGRTRLIHLLMERGQTEDILSQYLELASIYYQLADLETARSTYMDALGYADRANASRDWKVRLLHQAADIDMQRLAWKDSLRAYEQINKLSAYDEKARQMVIELSFRLGIPKQALAELDVFLQPMIAAQNLAKATQLMQELATNYPEEPGLVARLARLYQDQGQKAEAIAQYEQLAEMYVEAKQPPRAIEALRAIIALGPQDPTQYEEALQQLQESATPR